MRSDAMVYTDRDHRSENGKRNASENGFLTHGLLFPAWLEFLHSIVIALGFGWRVAPGWFGSGGGGGSEAGRGQWSGAAGVDEMTVEGAEALSEGALAGTDRSPRGGLGLLRTGSDSIVSHS